MQPLFSPKGLREFNRILQAKTLFAFDFDGTLAPIVKHPEAASLSENTAVLLRELNARAPLAIVSGRGVGDLESKFDFTPRFLIGNHGIEGLADAAKLAAAAEECRRWRSQLGELPAGVRLEDKTYSLSVHYRNAFDPRTAREKLLKIFGELEPEPQLIAGKAVFNILSRQAPHKGHAVLRLARQLRTRHLLFIGDDDTDEKVFDLEDRRVFGVRVGQRKDSRARYYLRQQSQIDRVLRHILDQIS